MASRDWKRTIATLALGGATVALGGSAASAAWAQGPESVPTAPAEQAPGPNRPDRAARQQQHQQFLAALAAKLNVSVEQLQQALEQTRQELGPSRPAERGGPGPGGSGQGGPGPGHFGPGPRQGGPGPGFFGRGGFGGLEAAAQALNLSVDQLRQELPGKSLAEVAQAHNVDPSTVANALKTQASSRLDEAVAAGRIPADQAAEMKQRLGERIDRLMTQQAPTGAPGPRGGPAPFNAPSGGEAPMQRPPSI
jgi:hypothetical protein